MCGKVQEYQVWPRGGVAASYYIYNVNDHCTDSLLHCFILYVPDKSCKTNVT